MKSLILECICAVDDERSLLKCVSNENEVNAAQILAENVRNDLIALITYTEFDYNLLFDGDLGKIMEYLQIFGEYLNGIVKILSNCNQIGQNVRKYFRENAKFLENVLCFMKNVAILTNTSNLVSRTDLCTVKTGFASILFTVIFDLYEPSFFLEIMKQSYDSEDEVNSFYERCIISDLVKTLVSKPVSTQLNDVDKEFLLSHYFVDISLINSKFITNAARSGESIELILKQLSGLLQKNSSQDVCLTGFNMFDNLLELNFILCHYRI